MLWTRPYLVLLPLSLSLLKHFISVKYGRSSTIDILAEGQLIAGDKLQVLLNVLSSTSW